MYPLIVISGPSGAGKSTVIKAIRKYFPELQFSVSVTTRFPRNEEVNGTHYHFVSEAQFVQMIRKGMFVEHIQREHRYGTVWSEAERVEAGPLVLDVDLAGARAIRTKYPQACLFFIAPPSVAELERRIRDRKDGMPESEIQSRLKRAEQELSAESLGLYDHVIVNDDRDACIAAVLAVIRAIL